MARHEFADPLSTALARLPSLAPRDSHDLRVRTRCRAELASIRAGSRRQSRPPRGLVLLASVTIALYVVSAITEALHVLAAAGG